MTHQTSAYEKLKKRLRTQPKRWLVTGAAGFIGSHLAQALLELDQEVVGLDNFATGRRTNLSAVENAVGPEKWRHFKFIKGDIRKLADCRRACRGVEYVLHQAALGSVPRSIENPLASHDANVNGFMNMLLAARDAGAKRFVYASSSSVYGDEETLPKREDKIGRPLSPYALTKYVNERYAEIFARCYGLESIGLRYFNVFGPRQDPNGPYAAVIPKWISAMQKGEPIYINGDGETSRDFCYVQNVVQANLLAATASRAAANQVYNVACNQRTSLIQLFRILRESFALTRPEWRALEPVFRPFRSGDVRHSNAAIEKGKALLGYEPVFSFEQGISLLIAESQKHSRNGKVPGEERSAARQLSSGKAGRNRATLSLRN